MAYFQMTRLALKWAVSKPVTTRYPFEPRVPIAGSRGLLHFALETCVFCTVCAKRCPTDAIVVRRTPKRWGIDRLLCISCGACVDACPRKSLTLTTAHGVAAITKDREYYGVQ